MTSKIRVWRSLVSRLNGVQEASSSNLDTRTKKTGNAFAFPVFFFCSIVRTRGLLIAIPERFSRSEERVGASAACNAARSAALPRVRISTLGPKKQNEHQLVLLFSFSYVEIRRPQMQQSGGLLLIPVQTLVSTLIFFCGCKRKCKRISTLGRYFCHCKKINKMFDNLLLRMIML